MASIICLSTFFFDEDLYGCLEFLIGDLGLDLPGGDFYLFIIAPILFWIFDFNFPAVSSTEKNSLSSPYKDL